MLREQAPAEVPVDAAYAAAEERAVRTTKALILAEAQVLTLQQTVRDLGEENTRLACELEQVTRERGEVTHDGATDAPEGTPAGGEVGTPHPFHD